MAGMKTRSGVWLRRYLPAEAVSLLAAVLSGSLAAFLSGDNPAITALVGAWGENVGYYATMVVREQHANSRQSVWRTMANLTLEFGVAEALDSMLIRPALMYGAGQLVSDVRLGVLIGKVVADVAFYVPTIAAFELRQRYADRGPTSALLEG